MDDMGGNGNVLLSSASDAELIFVALSTDHGLVAMQAVIYEHLGEVRHRPAGNW